MYALREGSGGSNDVILHIQALKVKGQTCVECKFERVQPRTETGLIRFTDPHFAISEMYCNEN